MTNLVFAMSYFTLAGLIWHYVLPACLEHGKLRATKMWALAMAFSLFGVGRLTDFVVPNPGTPLVYSFAHLCLLTYGTWLYFSIRRASPDAAWENIVA